MPKKEEQKKKSENKKPMTKKSPEVQPIKKFDQVRDRNISEEMRESYLDYAMSVIVSRALPDVRDGMKPVHRRILYAMWDIGLKANAKFRKSATVVGEVLGKYHPHGDQAVYDSMVRMAQDFAMRYELVNGQGNFGSMDGDGAAAMRYTEAKLTGMAEEMMFDLEKNTVDWKPNFDGSQKEPAVLPAKLPNLLLNGTLGIAVGMATSIPPHNLTELINGITHLIDNPTATSEDLTEFIQGPDFPTGGIIYNVADIKEAYNTGKGGVVCRAKTEIVENKNGSFVIIVKEIPYSVNKATLLEKIADLVKDKKIEGIKDLRDESNKDGVRIVIELKKEAFPKKILNQLFNHTQLQTTFHFNMLALIENGIQPRILNLKSILEEYIAHRQEVVTRRTQFELDKAKDRAHILEGLMLALTKIDAVIKTIKESKDRETAKLNLIKKFKLSERQANAILEMKLSQLANLERMKIETEFKDKQKLIKELTDILKSPKKILEIIKTEILEIKAKFGDERRTQIVKSAVDKFSQEDLIPDEPAIIVVTQSGYIKRLPPDTFKTQSRGGKGVMGLTTKEEDVVEHLISTTTHKDLLFFTTKGRAFELKAYEIPIASRTAKGQSIVNFLQLSPEEKISAILQLDGANDKYIAMVTAHGTIKKCELEAFKNIRRSGLIAIKLKAEDSLRWVKTLSDKDEIILISQHGKSIRFRETDVRAMGRTASGVRGINLKKNDQVIGMNVITVAEQKAGVNVLVVSENGSGKMTKIKEYRLQSRGGSGIKTANITSKTGSLVWSTILNPDRLPETCSGDLLIISDKGQVIRLPLKSVPVTGRDTQGVRLMRFKESADHVASVTLV